MPAINEPKLIAGNANRPLAEAIARRMSIHRGVSVGLVDARVERFNDGEVFVEVFDNVRGEDMFIIQSTSNPANDHLMEILVMADALRRSSAARITAVIPYFGYARQDRRAKARTPISAKLVANLITEAGVDRVLTLDLHAAQIQGFFDIPVDNLYASPIFTLDIEHHFKGKMDELMIVSPDVGGVARAVPQLGPGEPGADQDGAVAWSDSQAQCDVRHRRYTTIFDDRCGWARGCRRVFDRCSTRHEQG